MKKKPKYEVMPIYVHAKAAIVDDVWATIGSANLDGASLNQIELNTIVAGTLADAIETGRLYKRILLLVIMFLMTPLVMLAAIATKIGFARKTQHANPQQSQQPTRSTELNVVICEKDPNPTVPNRAVVDFREQLWCEHLGLTSLPSPTKGWVDVWNGRANEKLANLLKDSKEPVANRQKHPAKILKWTPKVQAKEYLRALGVPTGDLNVRSDADKFNVVTGRWEKS